MVAGCGLFLGAKDVFEFGLVFSGAAGARLGREDARGFGLADALAGVGLDGLGGGEAGWLAFRHGKDECGRSQVQKSSSLWNVRVAWCQLISGHLLVLRGKRWAPRGVHVDTHTVALFNCAGGHLCPGLGQYVGTAATCGLWIAWARSAHLRWGSLATA